MMSVTKIGPRDYAIEKLENYIYANHIPANSKIPSERDLCKLWNMNRTTLRFAIETLIEEGRLYRKPGSGTYVTPPKLVRNLLSVSTLSSSIRREGKSLMTKVLSERIMECTKQISRKLHIPLGKHVYEVIRLRIIDGVPSIFESMYMDCEQCPDFDQYDLAKTSLDSIIKNIYKKNVTSGYEKISVTYTTEEEAKHLEIEEGAPIFFTVGVTNLENGEPFQYYKALFRADRFKFFSEIVRESELNER